MRSLVLIAGIGFFALLSVIHHLFWGEIIEGQVGKQNFVAHMTESFARGDLISGFPVRYFVEIWHSGPIAWAEEFPLYHWMSASLSHLLHLNTVHSSRLLSFIFGLVLLYSVFQIARALFPQSRVAPILAPTLMSLAPSFQIYSTSVMPDLPMLAMIAWGYSLRLNEKTRAAYLALGVACLFKYFAIFSVGALFLYDCIREKENRSRFKSLAWAALVTLPTVAYVIYFIKAGVPNPVSEYQSANGYGHFAGPFLLRVHFYLRWITWVLVKNPGLILSILAVAGGIVMWKNRSHLRPEWKLIFTHLIGQLLFSTVFASAFFVHDYYAIGYLLVIVMLATYLLTQFEREWIRTVILVCALVLSVEMVRGATFRLTNYIAAAHDVANVLKDIPDRSRDQLVLFATDFSAPPIPILSKKSGWSYPMGYGSQFTDAFTSRLHDSRRKAFVFYSREASADAQWKELNSSAPALSNMKIVFEKHYPRESSDGPGAATVLKILR